MSAKILFGFHAVTVRLKTAPASVVEVHVDATRRDARMRSFLDRAAEAGADAWLVASALHDLQLPRVPR